MRISGWSSDVFSSDVRYIRDLTGLFARIICKPKIRNICRYSDNIGIDCINAIARSRWGDMILLLSSFWPWLVPAIAWIGFRSEEHTSELQSLMRISSAVFCLQKKKIKQILTNKYKI